MNHDRLILIFSMSPYCDIFNHKLLSDNKAISRERQAQDHLFSQIYPPEEGEIYRWYLAMESN